MPKRIKKLHTTKATTKSARAAKSTGLKRSKLDIFDIPDELLIDSPDNPQEMDDATFDELVEGIKADGFDEPILVIRDFDDEGELTGKYMIISGHHRRKGGRAAGMVSFPAIIKPDMEDAARKIALVRRNNLRGSLNKKKFTNLFLEVSPVLGAETAKRLMGFTKEAAFKKLYEDVSKAVPKEHRKQLDEAKETVKSVDDLSSVLNGIFRKEGSKIRKGYAVFSFGGKKHFYFQIEKDVAELLEEVNYKINGENRTANDVLHELLSNSIGAIPVRKKKVKVRGKGKT